MRDSLLLWDIDGTLVYMDRAGERSLLVAIRDLYQRDLGAHLPVDLKGRTDTSIARDLLVWLGVPVTPEEEARLRSAYLELLSTTLSMVRPLIHPGIRKALDAVHAHPEIHQALLTGNLREGARLKLTYLDLWRYFEFGAFADDSHIRDELGPFALRRAKEKLGIDFPPERVFIIGDTPHDVACGKAIGAKTIAVATGAFSVEELVALNPTHVFKDLSDTQALLNAIL
ncbi:MAG: haloacid dehalogenase-like hydrolase [Methylacidiphilales bacterium]|nr:haloacid dehalogenase-like hydrolase [Candidatus Methylacidiphilales bacterium]